MSTPISRMQAEPPGANARPPIAAKAAEKAPEPTVELDPVTHQPVAIRFPWLSRLSAALEAVAVNHWPFKSLSVTGENVDGSA